MPSSISSSEASGRFSPLRAVVFTVLLLSLLKGSAWLTRDAVIPIMPTRLEAVRRIGTLEHDSVSLGASYNVDVRHDLLGLRNVPLWLPVADLFETAALFEQIVKAGAAPAYAFIMLDPYQMYQDNGARDDWRMLNPASRDAAHGLLSVLAPFLPIDGDRAGWLEALFLPPRGIPPTALIRHLLPVPGRIEVPDRSPFARFEFNKVPDPAVPEHAREVADFVTPIIIGSVRADPMILERTSAELGRIADLAAAEGIELVVVVGIPLVARYRAELAARMIAAGLAQQVDLTQAIARATQTLEAAGATVIPLSAVWDTGADDQRTEWFADNRHLTAAGAAIFTRRLAPLLPAAGGGLLPQYPEGSD
ncbi:hypothetical protein DKT77_00895 [Meridianimarinicoccus roseus]|uniref:AlgX/AlgJ SGNH hydrolase-like domain-containing protein n=1 Tax=Meridianimarinicoccus roseus TaxID=2072018 RepID=A0A2V2LMX6_9RHOB|nr:hypothetical protein [Meridianimarinicoccus roseus]PWR04556.1 hypothetical protein DKT77_00895 [Meridianimarinicoccus roseus]